MASFRKRNDRWEYRITYNDPITNKRKEKTKGGFRTKKEAQIAAADVALNIDSGFIEKNDNIIIENYLDQWFEVYKHTVKESSWKNRQDNMKIIKTRIGSVQLKKVTLTMYQKFLNDLVNYYAKNTIASVHQVFSMMIKQAVRDSYFKINPIIDAKLPKKKNTVDKDNIEYWEKEELISFLTKAKEKGKTNDVTFFMLLAYSGLRIGEAACLKWSDIDFSDNKISVTKTLYQRKNLRSHMELTEPKTVSSIRKVPVPPQLIQQLKILKREQNELIIKNKKTYVNDNYIFTDKTGNIVSPRNYRYKMDTISRKAKVPRLTPHGLRHTYTALLIEAGIDVKEIQRRLGHSNIKTTLDVYAHVNKHKENISINQFNNFVDQFF